MPEHTNNNNAEHDRDMVTCEYCGKDEFWEDATHLPNVTTCKDLVCISRGRAALAHLVGEED